MGRKFREEEDEEEYVHFRSSPDFKFERTYSQRSPKLQRCWSPLFFSHLITPRAAAALTYTLSFSPGSISLPRGRKGETAFRNLPKQTSPEIHIRRAILPLPLRLLPAPPLPIRI